MIGMGTYLNVLFCNICEENMIICDSKVIIKIKIKYLFYNEIAKTILLIWHYAYMLWIEISNIHCQRCYLFIGCYFPHYLEDIKQASMYYHV